jgi:hypothetical protein
LFPIFGTCRPGGDRKREYYFLEGMTFPAETVIVSVNNYFAMVLFM